MNKKTIIGMLGLVAALVTMTSADVYTGNMVLNPYFEDSAGDPDYTGWSGWRNNGAAKNMVYDFKTDGTTGWFSATGATRDLTTDASITADANYDPSTTKLTGISFGNSWAIIPGWNMGNIATNMEGRFYCEAEIFTVGGDQYRINSSAYTIDDTWMGGAGGGQPMSWSTGNWASYGPWDGDAFASGGIALDQIDHIDYKWVMRVNTPNTDGAGTDFFRADNANVQYEVTTIPEPATLGLLAAMGGGVLWIRRRFHA
jgi:hypothetical protein